jgi:flagellar L-ring protein FlgH
MLWMALGCAALMMPPMTDPTAATTQPGPGAGPGAPRPPGALPPLDPPKPTVAPMPVAPVGSLWSEVGSRTLIGMDGNARRIGDLITVHIAESSSTTLDATTDATRSGSAELEVSALLGLETSITKANSNMKSGLTVGGGSSTSHNGSGSTSRAGNVTATLTCEVQEVLPNGNLRIRGTKEVRVNRETQYITLEGVVRPRDILLDNTVRSDVIADARVELTGAGIIASKQHQGWGTAVMDAVWPF